MTIWMFNLVAFSFVRFNCASAITTPSLSDSNTLTDTVYSLGASPTNTVLCRSDITTISLCPTHEGAYITCGQEGQWAIFCNQIQGGFPYYEVEHIATIQQCIEACDDFDQCDIPIITPDGKCVLQGSNEQDNSSNADFIDKLGWAALLPAESPGADADISATRSMPQSSSTDSTYFPSAPIASQALAGLLYNSSLASTNTEGAVGRGTIDKTFEFCEPTRITCPECNDSFLEDSLGANYQVFCDTKWVQRGTDKVIDFDTQRCMVQCESTPGCQGFTIWPGDKCGLAFGDSAYIGGLYPSQTAFLLNPSNFPTALPPGASGGTSSCPTHSISCPACADTYIKDNLGMIYQILCDSSLYSKRFYSVKSSRNAEECMTECDGVSWCKGASLENGNCALARGEDVFPVESFGSIAFLPVDLRYTPSPPQLSAFPTGSFTSARSNHASISSAKQSLKSDSKEVVSSKSTMRPFVTKASSTKTSLARTSPAKRSSKTTSCVKSSSARLHSTVPIVSPCSLENIRCQQCDRVTVVDSRKEKYRVQCNFQPICSNISSQGRLSQDDCMQKCDTDATCLAAIWNNGRCSLCEGSLEGLAMYESPQEYVVFVVEPRRLTNI